MAKRDKEDSASLANLVQQVSSAAHKGDHATCTRVTTYACPVQLVHTSELQAHIKMKVHRHAEQERGTEDAARYGMEDSTWTPRRRTRHGRSSRALLLALSCCLLRDSSGVVVFADARTLSCIVKRISIFSVFGFGLTVGEITGGSRGCVEYSPAYAMQLYSLPLLCFPLCFPTRMSLRNLAQGPLVRELRIPLFFKLCVQHPPLILPPHIHPPVVGLHPRQVPLPQAAISFQPP